jgi:Arc/MetJ family transcription regulator
MKSEVFARRRAAAPFAKTLKAASLDVNFRAYGGLRPMRTTVVLDDDLLAKAQAYTGVGEKSALLREALKALIERESALRLGRLGGSEPQLKPVPRRRPGDK